MVYLLRQMFCSFSLILLISLTVVHLICYHPASSLQCFWHCWSWVIVIPLAWGVQLSCASVLLGPQKVSPWTSESKTAPRLVVTGVSQESTPFILFILCTTDFIQVVNRYDLYVDDTQIYTASSFLDPGNSALYLVSRFDVFGNWMAAADYHISE